jgi:hypothetical protein
MLEHASLHVDGWSREEKAGLAVWIRGIQSATSQPVGFVRLQGGTSWFGWLRSVRLEVYETEDASHLMSVVRSLGLLRIWTVYDAEGRRVGSVTPRRLLDSEGERRGEMIYVDRREGEIIDLDRHVLARFTRKSGAALEVTFTADAAINPFLRMLVLGSILALEPGP